MVRHVHVVTNFFFTFIHMRFLVFLNILIGGSCVASSDKIFAITNIPGSKYIASGDSVSRIYFKFNF